jgi:hypothetical protein
MTDTPLFEQPVVHQLKNHLSVVISLCELLLIDLPAGPVRDDVVRIHDETTAALALAPQLRADAASPVVRARKDRRSNSLLRSDEAAD